MIHSGDHKLTPSEREKNKSLPLQSLSPSLLNIRVIQRLDFPFLPSVLLCLFPSISSSFIQMPCCWWIQSKAHLSLSGKHTLTRMGASCALTHWKNNPRRPEKTFCQEPKKVEYLNGNSEVNKVVPVVFVIYNTLSISASGDLDSLPELRRTAKGYQMLNNTMQSYVTVYQIWVSAY